MGELARESKQTSARATSPLGRRQQLIAAFIVAYIAVQVMLPLVLLWDRGGFIVGLPRTSRDFSWQMYGSRPGEPRWSIEFKSGKKQSVNPARHMTVLETRAYYGDRVAAILCESISNVKSVTRTTRRRSKTFKC